MFRVFFLQEPGDHARHQPGLLPSRRCILPELSRVLGEMARMPSSALVHWLLIAYPRSRSRILRGQDIGRRPRRFNRLSSLRVMIPNATLVPADLLFEPAESLGEGTIA